MVQFKEFVDAYAEIYNLQNQERSLVINNAVKHLSKVLLERENFRAVCGYIKEFVDHYNAMKERHLEHEVQISMTSGDSFLEACKEWDI